MYDIQHIYPGRMGIRGVQMYGAPSPPEPFDWVPAPYKIAPIKVPAPSQSQSIPVSDVQKTLEVLMKIRTYSGTAKDHIPILDELIGYFLSVKANNG